jgi:hypothetical protein
MTQNAFNICKLGWVGKSVVWSGTVWTTNPVYASDGITVTTPGVPRDVSGWTFMLTVKAKYSDPDSAAVFSIDWQIGDGTSGVWSATMDETITGNLNPGSTLVWDLAIIMPGAEPIMAGGGTIAIQNTVTRRFTPVLT